MQCTISFDAPEKIAASTLVVGRFSDEEDALSRALDHATRKKLARLWQEEPDRDSVGALFRYTDLPGIAAPRVLIVSLGARAKFTARAWAKAVQAAAQALASGPTGSAAVALAMVDVPGMTRADAVQYLSMALENATYRYDATLGENKAKVNAPRGAEAVALVVAAEEQERAAELQAAIERGQAIAAGMRRARQLADLPPNVCTPEYLAASAEEIAGAYGLKCRVLERKDAEKLGMGAFLAVAAGAKRPPKIIVLEYRGTAAKKAERRPIALVGKGITFDSGGICLKPAAQLDEMKFDMAGAAAVLGTMEVVARLQLPLDVVAVIPATENMPGSAATRAGDVVTTMSGKTVEILNTDAEGRLILCDALTYVQRHYQPRCIVDVATLTGAVIIALGKEATGVIGNDETLIAALLAAGERAFDRGWQLPLWEEYQEGLKSRFADVANISSDRGAGSIIGAAFLSRFIENDTPWVHLDIAGTAWVSGEKKGATGRPVPMLSQWLWQLAHGEATAAPRSDETTDPGSQG